MKVGDLIREKAYPTGTCLMGDDRIWFFGDDLEVIA